MGGHSCLGSRLTFYPKHAQLGSCLDSELAIPWPQHPVGQNGCRVTCCMGWGIVLEVHKVTSKHPCRPWRLGRTQGYVQTPPSPMATFDSSGSGCTDTGSWLHPPQPAHSSLDCTPHHDWRATISIIRLDAGINQPLPLPTAHPDQPSLWHRENRDSSLKMQCLHCLRSHTLCLLPHSWWCRLCSKVSLGHLAGRRDQYPVAQSCLRTVRTDIRFPNERIICIRKPRSEMKQFILTIWSSWRSSCGMEIFIRTTLPMMWSASLSIASQNFAYAFLRHTQHPGYFSLRIAICWQPNNSLQYLLWQILWHDSLQKFREISIVFTETPHCIKSIKVVMARQTSLQVTTPELTFFLPLTLSGPQTILTVFGYSIWLCNELMKSTVFRSAIEHTTRSNKYRSN